VTKKDGSGTSESVTPISRRRPAVLWVGVVLLAGLGIRIALGVAAPKWGYTWDHFDNIGTGLTAEKNGLLRIYSVDRDDLAVVHGRVWRVQAEQFVPMDRKAATPPNYPPLYVLARWVQVKVLRVVQGGDIFANTVAARLIMSTLSFVAELATAIGVMLLAWRVFGQRVGLIAGAVAWLFPPIMLNGVFWGQVDALILAPTVFAVWLMLRREWVWAGVCVGLAMMLKPQGVLLGPVVLFAGFALAKEAGPAWRQVIVRLAKVGLAALAVIVVVAGAWMAAEGLAWLDRSYLMSFTEAFPYTTLKGFNVWYVDLLRLDARGAAEPMNSQVEVWGISKDLWGRTALLGSLAAAAALSGWRYRRVELGVVVFAAIWLWSIYIWPTRVHERFLIYCTPLVIVLAVGSWRYLPALVGLIVVGIAAHTWPLWLGTSAGAFSPRMVDAYYQAMENAYRQRAGEFGGRRVDPPTRQDASRVVWERYRQARRDVARSEWLITVISLASYAWMWPAAFAVGSGAAMSGRRRKT